MYPIFSCPRELLTTSKRDTPSLQNTKREYGRESFTKRVKSFPQTSTPEVKELVV